MCDDNTLLQESPMSEKRLPFTKNQIEEIIGMINDNFLFLVKLRSF